MKTIRSILSFEYYCIAITDLINWCIILYLYLFPSLCYILVLNIKRKGSPKTAYTVIIFSYCTWWDHKTLSDKCHVTNHTRAAGELHHVNTDWLLYVGTVSGNHQYLWRLAEKNIKRRQEEHELVNYESWRLMKSVASFRPHH